MKTKQTTPDGKKENKKPPPEIVYKSNDLITLGIIEETQNALNPLVISGNVPRKKGKGVKDRDTIKKTNEFEIICNLIANKAYSLNNAINVFNKSKNETFTKNVFYYLVEKDVSYKNHYVQACERRADLLVEASLKNSTNADDDWYFNDKGTRVPNPVKVQRDRLKMDAIKWIASKMHPKKYGDKIDISAKITATQVMTLDDAKAIIKELEG